MPEKDFSIVAPMSPEHRRVAAGQYERANQVIATGNFDYGIRLLLSCCKLDPGNLVFRQTLRRTEKAKFKNNLRGSLLSWLTSSPKRAKIKAAKHAKEYVRVLELGEEVLVRNPWDTGVQMDMADAAETLGLRDIAIWILEQARQKNPRELTVNRHLARLYEKRGNFTQAMALWELIRKDDPADQEAMNKAKDLAAHETMSRLHHEDFGPQEGAGIATLSARAETPRTTASDDAHATPLPNFGSTPPEGMPLLGGERLPRETALLRERVQAHPTDPFGYMNLAAQFRRLGRLEDARAVLESGLGPTGHEALLTFELADLEIEPFRRNLAVTDAKIQQEPDNDELKKIRIRFLKEINARELDLYRQKTERFPAELGHRFEYGLRLLRANQVDEAIQALQASRSDQRYLWRSLLYLGYCFKNRNNWRLARRNFEECLQYLPIGEDVARKEVLFQLARGCADDGDLKSALEYGGELANLDFAYRDIGQLTDEWQDQFNQTRVS